MVVKEQTKWHGVVKFLFYTAVFTFLDRVTLFKGTWKRDENEKEEPIS